MPWKENQRSYDDMRGLPSVLCPLQRIVLEYQPLLLRCFDSTGDIASNPLEGLSSLRDPDAALPGTP